MKLFILSLSLLIFSTSMEAQTHDLSFYQEQAKANSPVINKSKNDNKIVTLDLKQIKSILLKPEINLDANVLFAPIVSHDNNSNRFELVSKGANNYTGYDQAATDGGQYQALISIKQRLLTASNYREYSKKANISHQINKNDIALTTHELEQLVSHQYILCLKSKKQSEISIALIKELKGQLQAMHQLVEHAIYKQSDLMLLQIEVQNNELEYKTYLAEYKNNLLDLNLLCGINDTTVVQIQDTDFKLKQAASLHSQFLNSYKLDSLNIAADKILFEQKYKPQLNLFANVGLNSVYAPSFNRFGFSTGIGFTWNIFDGHQKKFQREKSTVQLETLEFGKQNFITQFNVNRNKYLNQIDAVNQQINITSKQLNEYTNLMDLYKVELSHAQVSIMDFKNLFKDIAAKKQENLQLKMEKQALISLYNYWNY